MIQCPSSPRMKTKSPQHPRSLLQCFSLSTSAVNQIIHLPTTASQNLFTGHNLYHWPRFVVRMLKPTKLDNHLTDSRPNEEDAHYYKWLEEEEILITWILDSVKP